jgi:hypothetical protein
VSRRRRLPSCGSKRALPRWPSSRRSSSRLSAQVVARNERARAERRALRVGDDRLPDGVRRGRPGRVERRDDDLSAELGGLRGRGVGVAAGKGDAPMRRRVGLVIRDRNDAPGDVLEPLGALPPPLACAGPGDAPARASRRSRTASIPPRRRRFRPSATRTAIRRTTSPLRRRVLRLLKTTAPGSLTSPAPLCLGKRPNGSQFPMLISGDASTPTQAPPRQVRGQLPLAAADIERRREALDHEAPRNAFVDVGSERVPSKHRARQPEALGIAVVVRLDRGRAEARPPGNCCDQSFPRRATLGALAYRAEAAASWRDPVVPGRLRRPLGEMTSGRPGEA